jgi:dolichol-phosphate mannosyltransferase
MISVVLPTYNERQAAAAVVAEVLAVTRRAGLETEIIVVDDDSPDGTAFHLGETFRTEPSVRVWVRRGQRGLATAVRRGMDEARGEIIAVMDADGNHDPSLLPRMAWHADHFDIIVGSRYVPGGGMPISVFRSSGSRAFNLLVRLVLGLRIRDSLSGYLAIRRTWLGQLDPDRVFVGYGDYAIRLLYHTAARHGRVLELPTVYRPRKGGTSKTRLLSCAFMYLGTVVRLRLGLG